MLRLSESPAVAREFAPPTEAPPLHHSGKARSVRLQRPAEENAPEQAVGLDLRHRISGDAREAVMATGDVSLNPSIRSADTIEFQNALRAKNRRPGRWRSGPRRVVPGLHRWTQLPRPPPSAICSSSAPPAPAKTRIVEAAAEILFGSPPRRHQNRLRRIPALP